MCVYFVFNLTRWVMVDGIRYLIFVCFWYTSHVLVFSPALHIVLWTVFVMSFLEITPRKWSNSHFGNFVFCDKHFYHPFCEASWSLLCQGVQCRVVVKYRYLYLYLYLSTILSVLDVLEYLIGENAKYLYLYLIQTTW